MLRDLDYSLKWNKGCCNCVVTTVLQGAVLCRLNQFHAFVGVFQVA
jgi:hypothetical protein